MSPRWPPIPPMWQGETVYVIGGGPSFEAVNPDRLRGRNIVVVNTSWVRVPFADVLFFGDDRWWRHWKVKVCANFEGRILSTTTVSDLRVSRLRNTAARRGLAKKPPFLLSADPMSVPMRRTSLGHVRSDRTNGRRWPDEWQAKPSPCSAPMAGSSWLLGHTAAGPCGTRTAVERARG
jgi:hypothetical protein